MIMIMIMNDESHDENTYLLKKPVSAGSLRELMLTLAWSNSLDLEVPSELRNRVFVFSENFSEPSRYLNH